MKNRVKIFVGSVAVLVFACDPGMTIRQTKSAPEAKIGNNATVAQVAIDVKTSRQLIGETHYAPRLKITNASNSSISITSVDLISQGETYPNKPTQPGLYPLVVQPGRTEDLPVWFDLNDGVKKIFQQLVELRVYYTKDNKEQIAHTSVVGVR